jgi:hypothetical protein
MDVMGVCPPSTRNDLLYRMLGVGGADIVSTTALPPATRQHTTFPRHRMTLVYATGRPQVCSQVGRLRIKALLASAPKHGAGIGANRHFA